MLDNLQPKCIMDFTPEDTIYIQRTTGNGNNKSSTTFLCQFKEYRGNRIIGTAISTDINPSLHERDIENGLELSGYLHECALYGKHPVDDRVSFHWFKSSGYAIYPMEYGKVSENATFISEHPSYGMVGLSRRSSRGTVLFGSSITHNEIIALTIQTATLDRQLNTDWIHAKDELIEIEMSANQFAEFITSPNIGSGVPCTIRHIQRTKIPEPPYESKVDKYSQEFKNSMTNLVQDLGTNNEVLQNILQKPNINKGDREEIARLFDRLVNVLSSGVPFIEKQFVEQMDKTVTEAKAEIEAFVSRRISEEGVKALTGGSGASIFLEAPKTKEHE